MMSEWGCVCRKVNGATLCSAITFDNRRQLQQLTAQDVYKKKGMLTLQEWWSM